MTVERRNGTGKAVLVLPFYEAVPTWLAARAQDTVLQLGPRRWLLLCEGRDIAALMDSWRARLGDATHLLEDASDRFVALRVSGADAELSEQLVEPIDALAAGTAIRTLLGEVPVICHRRADGVDVLVDRSHAHYVEAWLRQTLNAA